MISLSEPILGDKEKAAVAAVLDSGWLTMGEKVKEFESSFAAMHGQSNAVAVNSCTAGLHLALAALDIKQGDEVLLPSLTFIATVNAVKYVGATPVFVDIPDITHPHISIEHAKTLLTKNTKAVMVMHYGGYLSEMQEWRNFADEHGLFLIEDAAHAPACPGVGLLGDVTSYSFFSNKNMTTSDGGMVTSTNEEALNRIRLMRSHGMTTVTLDRHKGHAYSYDVVELGFNYRLDEIRAVIGIEQLKNVQAWNEKRRALSKVYREQIQQSGSKVQEVFSADMATSAHLFPVLLPTTVKRESVMDGLRASGIQSSIHYPPAHKFTYYQSFYPELELPLTEAYCARELSLPLHPMLTEQDVCSVVEALNTLV